MANNPSLRFYGARISDSGYTAIIELPRAGLPTKGYCVTVLSGGPQSSGFKTRLVPSLPAHDHLSSDEVLKR
jgi:hypothetical protein